MTQIVLQPTEEQLLCAIFRTTWADAGDANTRQMFLWSAGLTKEWLGNFDWSGAPNHVAVQLLTTLCAVDIPLRPHRTGYTALGAVLAELVQRQLVGRAQGEALARIIRRHGLIDLTLAQDNISLTLQRLLSFVQETTDVAPVAVPSDFPARIPPLPLTDLLAPTNGKARPTQLKESVGLLQQEPAVTLSSSKQLVTEQPVNDLLRNACEIMRRSNCARALQYVPELTWILFLRVLDARETQEAAIAKALGQPYVSSLMAPYRWQDWAAPHGPQRVQLQRRGSGALFGFVNSELLPYLRSQATQPAASVRQQVIGGVLSSVGQVHIDTERNFLDVLDTVHQISNAPGDPQHTAPLAQAYDKLLLKLGEKPRDGSHFFTSRAVIRVMIQTIDPQSGETVYDPCCGTGGFLAQAYEYMAAQLGAVGTSEALETLKTQTFYAREKDNLTYPVALTNLILHGIDHPHLWHGNTLTGQELHEALFTAVPDFFDVILSNLPSGSHERAEVQTHFAYKTGATQVLFLQHVMDALKPGGRAAVVLNESVLSGTQVQAWVQTKRKLLNECNLWAIICLPGGVFTSSNVRTNILFFSKGSPTEKVWYYDLSTMKVSKTHPITLGQFADFARCLPTRSASTRSWTVERKVLESKNYDLRAVNPHSQLDREANGQAGSVLRDSHDPTVCPYPGMAAFQPADARFFHGRDANINTMFTQLRHQPVLLILGVSGSGKSSVVAAGLLARLPQQRTALPGPWYTPTIRPGAQPLVALALALGGDPQHLAATVAGCLAAHPPMTRLLLVVDQLEEVFSQATLADQKAFFATLTALAALPNCKWVATLRADFYQDLVLSDLWPVVRDRLYTLDPLRGADLRAAITAPAAEVGVQIDPALVERLLAHAAEEPGTLPLLQETLRLLWDRVTDQALSLAAYDALGNTGQWGLAAAVSAYADSVLVGLSAAQRALAPRIFLRLIQFGEGRLNTRRQQPVAALMAAGDDPAVVDSTTAALVDARLLVSSAIPSAPERRIDLTHEILITQWPTLQGWVTARRAAETYRRELEDQAAGWDRRGRQARHLLDAAELATAQAWQASADGLDLGLSTLAVAYLRASAAGDAQTVTPAPPPLRYPDRLAGADQLAGQTAVLAAFPTRTALTQAVRTALEVNLATISDGPNLEEVVFGLLEWAQAQGRLPELLAGLAGVNPGNPELRAWRASLPLPLANVPPVAVSLHPKDVHRSADLPSVSGSPYSTATEPLLLEPEQQELLAALVTATRALPRDQREEFMLVTTFGGTTLQHPGLPGGALEKLYVPDFMVLAQEGLLELRPMSNSPHDYFIFVTPRGLKHHDQLSSGASATPSPGMPPGSSIAVDAVASAGGAVAVGGNVYDNRNTTNIYTSSPPNIGLDPTEDLLLRLLTQQVQTFTSFRAGVLVQHLIDLARVEGISEQGVAESLATLEPDYIELTHYLGPPLSHQRVSLTVRGTQYGLRRVLPTYDALVLNVATQVVAHPHITSWELAQSSDTAHMLIKHALQVLHDKGFLHVTETTGLTHEMGSLIHVETVSAKLTKFLRNPNPAGLTL